MPPARCRRASIPRAEAINVQGSIFDYDPADFDQVIQVDLVACWYLIRAVIGGMRDAGRGSIVNISSVAAYLGGRGHEAPYSAAKAGLTQLGRVAALELGGKGIRVNTLHPDAVYDTALWSEDTLAQRAAAYGLSVQAYKTKNLLATEVSSTDVAEAVFLFAGTRLAKSTGVQLPIDGGNERVV